MRPSARRTIRYLTVILVALAACTGSTAAANGSSEARLIVGLRAGVSSSSARGSSRRSLRAICARSPI
jgi:hypothetical protein